MRLLVGSAVFLAAHALDARSRRSRAPPLTRTDWLQLLFLGLVGTFLYQLCFVGGVRRTSVGNGSLIVGISPIVIALMSAVAGHERISPMRWVGVFMAMLGLYFVVGHGVELLRADAARRPADVRRRVLLGHLLGGVAADPQAPLARSS